MSNPDQKLVDGLGASIARTAALGAVVAGTLGMTGCISDSDCGICDPDKLVLESISGINYTNRKVHRLTPGVDSGKYFIEDIKDCELTEEAEESARGAEEYCKLSPLVTANGLEFVFNNLLDPTSIELVRKDPSNPQLFQVYDWKSRIAEIKGPITRFNGDYFSNSGDTPDTVPRAINLTCAENIEGFNHELLDSNPQVCDGFYAADPDEPNKLWPLRVEWDGTTKAYDGETDWRGGNCSAPDEGPDTCCTVCDYELSVNVAKYGVDDSGTALNPHTGTVITCDPAGNVYEECAGFITSVDRSNETNRYRYEWNGSSEEFRLPLSDKIRETHPDLRPAGVEPDGAPCQTDADCSAQLGSDPGAVCIGETPEGVACSAETPDCANKHCKAEWFVTCKDDTANTGLSVCVDRRFKDKGAGACYVGTQDFQSCVDDGMGGAACTTWDAGNRLAMADVGEFLDNVISAEEGCQDALGGPTPNCDPLFQDNVTPRPRFDRDRTLPEETRDCFCGDPNNQPEYCADQIDKFCTAPWGNLTRHDGESNEGNYVTRFVSKVGGVIYDPALKGVLYLPGDRGNQPRSTVESCAALATSPDLIGGRNIQDGWRMHDTAFFENYENFDRGMCSASRYEIVFATEGERIRDKVGNVLEDERTTYVFETPDFHVIPGSGFPTDNLRIGACDDFEIRVSNKYDLSPHNINKIQLVEIEQISGEDDDLGESCETSLRPECWEPANPPVVVAGGTNCTDDPELVGADTPPCMTVDVSLQREGSLRMLIDSVRFPDAKLDVEQRYRMVLPGLDNVESFHDLDLKDNQDHIDAYNAAFHDVCGMPLITKGGAENDYKDFYYDFTIDKPKCKEDEDKDGVQLSCDNARDHYNPQQEDQDFDGFGDVYDTCVLTPSDSNTADSDRDGIGNDCDTCRQPAGNYNLDMAMVADPRMWVRNVPLQRDFDQDGIGDVCDNCVVLANCGVFGPDNPHTVGAEVPWEDLGVCQTDNDSDMIGDNCVNPDDENAPILFDAAGVVGFENADDFDQDGINNLEDYCPRQPLLNPQTCTADADCVFNGVAGVCSPTANVNGDRFCNHVDTDLDQVGDICDTCPFAPNPMQVTDTGMQIDDEDGDFVGADCETNQACYDRKDPRPYTFMDVAVNGQCCTTIYPGDGQHEQDPDTGEWGCDDDTNDDGIVDALCDLDGFPIQLNCDPANEAVPGEDEPNGTLCRKLPNAVASLPGVVELPPGCEEALANAGITEDENVRLTLDDVASEDELWSKMCFLPQWDQDFDGIGDACDLCKFAYDPFNEPYVDQDTGKLWPNIGRFCAGEYAPDAICAAEDEEEGGGTDTGDTGGDTDTGG